MRIDVRTNIVEAKRDLAKLEANIRQRAIARALNKTAEQGKTQMRRAIAQEFAIAQADVGVKLMIRKAREGYFGGLLSVEISALQSRRGRGFNVIRFMERKVSLAQARRRRKAGTLKDLHFKIKRGGELKRIRGAFIGNKGRTVFMREGKARLPIKAVTTIDVPQMFNTKRINQRVVRFLQEKFPEVLKREIDYYVGRFGR